jgi:hypothetical protein
VGVIVEVVGRPEGVKLGTLGAVIRGIGPEDIIGTGIPRPIGTA